MSENAAECCCCCEITASLCLHHSCLYKLLWTEPLTSDPVHTRNWWELWLHLSSWSCSSLTHDCVDYYLGKVSQLQCTFGLFHISEQILLKCCFVHVVLTVQLFKWFPGKKVNDKHERCSDCSLTRTEDKTWGKLNEVNATEREESD